MMSSNMDVAMKYIGNTIWNMSTPTAGCYLDYTPNLFLETPKTLSVASSETDDMLTRIKEWCSMTYQPLGMKKGDDYDEWYDPETAGMSVAGVDDFCLEFRLSFL